jgi:hypothetical protein
MQLSQERAIPCTGCSTPCCTFLPLYDFQITDHHTLDYALYLIGFSNIEFALIQGTTWRVHYRMRCSNLNKENLCVVHNTPQKPSVCRTYDPFRCFYVKTFGAVSDPAHLRFDRARFLLYAAELEFNEDREIISYPDMTILCDALPPFVENNAPPVPVNFGKQRSNDRVSASFFRDPCGDCRSYCCKSLSFPRGLIHSYSEMDYLRFCLGFPGVELTVNTQMQWTVVVRTRCTQLTGEDKCLLYDDLLRPQVCSLYDQNACAYRSRYTDHETAMELRVHMDDLLSIRDASDFLQSGEGARIPSFIEIKDLIQR